MSAAQFNLHLFYFASSSPKFSRAHAPAPTTRNAQWARPLIYVLNCKPARPPKAPGGDGAEAPKAGTFTMTALRPE